MRVQTCENKEERLALVKKTVEVFKERAGKHDKEGSFPFENVENLREIGYPALTVPKVLGGSGISLEELLQHQEMIAAKDGSTALAIGWHMGIMMHEGEVRRWEGDQYEQFAKDVVTNGALINSAASERATGSPTRGGRPETNVQQSESGWLLNGRKTFATLAPVLDYIIVSASINGTEDVARFIVRRHLPGVSVDETWDSIAMAATGSHDFVFENVELPKDALLEYENGRRAAQGWLLHIPACYLGIAKAAAEEATRFAANYAPNSIEGTISDIPGVQQKIGQYSLWLFEAETMLYAIARKWDAGSSDERQALQPALGAVKVSVMERVLKVVDVSMRVVGARGLSATSPMQRYYRDIRAGLHNPPMEDMVWMQLAKQAIDREK